MENEPVDNDNYIDMTLVQSESLENETNDHEFNTTT